MQKKIKYIFIGAIAIFLNACAENSSKVQTFDKTDEIKLNSYAMGASIGTYINKSLIEHEKLDINLEKEIVIMGFNDAVFESLQLSESEIKNTLAKMQTTLGQKIQEKNTKSQPTQEEISKNKKESESFLIKNKAKENVITTKSGLQYKVLKKGDGQKPEQNDKVKVHYTGKLINGNVFDSSKQRNEPITFALSNVIKGWTEGVQLMTVGSVYELVIPSKLAYGTQGAGTSIPPNSTLIFEIELLEIVK